jgi:hypothetical protein
VRCEQVRKGPAKGPGRAVLVGRHNVTKLSLHILTRPCETTLTIQHKLCTYCASVTRPCEKLLYHTVFFARVGLRGKILDRMLSFGMCRRETMADRLARLGFVGPTVVRPSRVVPGWCAASAESSADCGGVLPGADGVDSDPSVRDPRVIPWDRCDPRFPVRRIRRTR